MPSSLVFAALALAWIVILVPTVARRRQEVRRTADSALAARVLRRGDAGVGVRPEEVSAMPEIDAPYAPYQPYEEPAPRPYRPGRGGFDPYAAELAARAKYAFRQRVVLCLLLTALASGLFAAFALPVVWWMHAATDLVLVSYLAYLRRQVRIEHEIRQRRLHRARRALQRRPVEEPADAAAEPEPQPPPMPPSRLPQRTVAPPGTLVVDLDDEDPILHDLDGELPTPYRRAAGE
jgi:hypothetical protein